MRGEKLNRRKGLPMNRRHMVNAVPCQEGGLRTNRLWQEYLAWLPSLKGSGWCACRSDAVLAPYSRKGTSKNPAICR